MIILRLKEQNNFMRKILSKPLFFYLALLFCVTSAHAQTPKTDENPGKLLVGVAGSEPFVFDEGNKGIAVEIWHKIADENSLDYEFVHFKNVDDALNMLRNDKLDIVVGPISITSRRLETMRFSQPFYNSSISIISRTEKNTFWQKIKPFFSLKLVMAIFIFLIILAIVGTFLWLAERKESPEQFPKEPMKGIGTGMWLAIVTMSTTGYGDKAPVTFMGRVIAGTWMVVSIIFATSMVAGIASTLTVSSLGTTTLSNIEQLSDRNVASISGSSSEEFLTKSKIKVTGVNSLSEAIKKLQNKDVDAVVYDRPQLLYYLKENDNENLYISKAEYYKQGYGFAFSSNSKLVSGVNKTLLKLAENQETARIIHYYIQKDE